MDLFIYSDESGVFDKIHNNYFVFAGVIFLDKETKDIASRKFMAAEKALKRNENYKNVKELKANVLSVKDKNSLFRSLNKVIKFAVIINQKKILSQIFDNKKSKQRYLDYAYKIALKKTFQDLIKQGIIKPKEVDTLHIFVDEHTTATNGRYELKEALEQEFKHGTFNYTYQSYFPPIFSGMNGVDLQYCDSKTKVLIRAADIIANMIYYAAVNNDEKILNKENLYLTTLP